jgi:hypothetical protein
LALTISSDGYSIDEDEVEVEVEVEERRDKLGT